MNFHLFVLIFIGIVTKLEAKWKKPWNESVTRAKPIKLRRFDDVTPFDKYKEMGPNTLVFVGTPRDEHDLNIRTNHKTFWLTDSNFQGRSDGGFYDPKNSTTSIVTGKNSTEFYGKAKLSGRQIIDTITLKATRFPHVKTFKQTFNNLVKLTTESYKDLAGNFDDGLVGYGWNTSENGRNLTHDSPIILHILDGLENRTVTFHRFRHAIEGGGVEIHNISYGKHFDFNMCHPYIHQIPFNNEGEMTFNVDQFQFGKYSMNRKYKAWIDSQAFFIALPSTLHRYILKTLKPVYNETMGIYEVDCYKRHTLPDAFFTMKEEQFGVHPIEYVSQDWLPLNECVLLLVENDTPDVDIVFGSPFMRSWCTTLDIDNNLLGLSASFHSE